MKSEDVHDANIDNDKNSQINTMLKTPSKKRLKLN